ncbi:NADP-dependent oxidoreductase [Chitinophaga pinensis]|uniref:Alcohol dehydrogenase GroES domain protein n=1 Tax=Chitinophaga pinensis (strain ATCC 43595 / DSM 2588 / LMG 13176 / NBRC 15968 / NCIMB 11800 / UQM 2034) TaxID=485918 RepID=A0A979GSV4_CHIPD|nr:NADP-dependent oxidoreductase [Chitinophaga pinensis]ACU59421.1 Alcohol dehydrogenase GroES domain protein [Chitinophaga pinensis DSM 2588]
MSNFMQAAVLPEFGPATAFRIEKVAIPLPGAGEVLVKVKAIGLNPVDFKTRSGKGYASFQTLPAILGWDIAGEVVSVGEGVSKFITGDRIFGMSNFPNPGNAYAEYAVVQEDEFAIIPKDISFEVAAGTPLAGLTAWEALFDHAGITWGQRVLIQAAAGGVGHIAVQLAKWKHCFVAATASAANHPFLEQLGVDQLVDYKTQKFEEVLDGMDVIIDGMGGETALHSLDILNRGGILVSLPSMYKDDPAVIAKAKEKGVEVKWMSVRPSGERMEQLAALLSNNRLRVEIGQTFPLTDIVKAHQALENGHGRGKIVLTV